MQHAAVIVDQNQNKTDDFVCAGKKSTNRQFDTYGAPYGQNDVIGCLLDWETNTISFTKNGEDLGPAFQIPGQVQGKALFPAICLKNAELVVNFGEQKLQYGPPKGFAGLAKAPPEWISSGNKSHTKCCFWACEGTVQHKTLIQRLVCVFYSRVYQEDSDTL